MLGGVWVGRDALSRVPDWEVIPMIKSDILSGLLVGLVLGLVFTAELAPHLAVIVILAVLFGAKMIGPR